MKANFKDKITASSTFNILGTYEGEALDTNITNNNGLDITAEVIDVLLESDDYKTGLEHGWYIGFLGHPNDPNCMDFRNACIVMTDMWRNDDGKVYAKFNLVDTPVGQIVKKFQEAGVTFGISIRGSGDIEHNSVDPETFVFRGFDLVSFPAYPESIPTYTAIAASTNLEDRKKYKAICAAVQTNLESIDSVATIETLKTQFAPQSNEYKMLSEREGAIKGTIKGATESNLDKEKIQAMTQLYIDTLNKNKELTKQLEAAKKQNKSTISACNRKLSAMKRITGSQMNNVLSELDEITASNMELDKQVKILGSQLSKVKNSNLIYKQRIETSTNELNDKKEIIASLKQELRETVTASTRIQTTTSNLGEDNERLKDELSACKNSLKSCEEQLYNYQDAYAALYANMLGVNPNSLSISANMTVADMQKYISSATNTACVPSTTTLEPMYVIEDDDVDDISLVTI